MTNTQHGKDALETGWKLYRAKNFKDAASQFRESTRHLPEGTPDYEFAVSAFFFMLIKSNQPEQYCQYLHEYTQSDFFNIYLACWWLYKQDWDHFWREIEATKPFQPRWQGPWMRGTSTLPSSFDWWQRLSALPKKNHHRAFNVEKLPESSEVAVFSSDSQYFDKFHDEVLRSARANGWYAQIHFHIINPTPDILDVLANLRPEGVTHSVEYIEKPQKATFASARFFVAQEFLHVHEIPTWVFDIDVSFIASPRQLFESFGWKETFLGVRYTNNLTLPWQKMTANAMYIPPTGQGKSYIASVCDYLDYMFKVRHVNDLWWIDQNAIFFALMRVVGLDRRNFQVFGAGLGKILKLPDLFQPKEKGMFR
jgi:hypothetical protein